MSFPDFRVALHLGSATQRTTGTARGRRFAAVLLFTVLGAMGVGSGALAEAARFVVTPEVINPDLKPFTATVSTLGNGRIGFGGYEPTILRTALIATQGGADRLCAPPASLSRYDVLRSGAFDGAEVTVRRIERGRMRVVRRDRVAPGGFRASGWVDEIPGGQIVTDPRFEVVFPAWYRPDATTWFAVRAVHASGALSELSSPVQVRSTPMARAVRTDNRLAKRPGGQDGRVDQPRGLAAEPMPDGRLILTWEPVSGAVGYIVMRTDADPVQHQGHCIVLEGGVDGPPLRAGDHVVLARLLQTPDRERLVTDRVWNTPAGRLGLPRSLSFWPEDNPGATWRLAPHPPDSPVPEGGRTYLELTLGPGVTRRIGRYNHAGADQSWYAVLAPEPYRVEVWLRSDHATNRPNVRFLIEGPYGKLAFPAQSLPVTTEWRPFVLHFTPPRLLETGKAGQMLLEFTGPGRLDIDNLRIFRADTAHGELEDRDYARLAESGMGMLRTHGFIKTGIDTYDLAALLGPPGTPAYGFGTLPQVLAIFDRAGVDPWLQIEPHFSPEEWLGLVEFLAAPFDPVRDDPADKPWAALRYAQGRTEPWTDAFGTIFFELGNETWNRLFRPWTFEPMPDAATGRSVSAGTVYGLFMEHVIETMQASPYWAQGDMDDVVRFVLGGFQGDGDFTLDAARASPRSDYITVAAYNGGWDEGEGPPQQTPASYASVLNQVTQTVLPRVRALSREADAIGRDRGRPMLTGTYEAGPGYAMNGLNGARVTDEQDRAQEAVMKSQAAGVATLDSFLTQAAEGLSVMNFFTYGEGARWRSHALWHKGGHAYPSWALLSLFNRVGLGDMLRVETRSVPRRDLPAVARRPAVRDAPQVAVYATRSGDRLTVTVLSRRVAGYPDAADDGYTPLQVQLPIRSAAGLTLHRMAGPLEAHNLETEAVRIETVPLAVPADPARLVLGPETGTDSRGLPPGSALIYVFDGVRY